MNIQKIRAILDMPLEEKHLRYLILKEIATNKQAITTILEILDIERQESDAIIDELNSQFSRSLAVIQTPRLIKDKTFIFKKAKELFDKHKPRIGCTYANVID